MKLLLEQIAQTCSDGMAQGQSWFATLDAAQIPANCPVDWQAQNVGWGNLLAGSNEGELPNLTCWLLPLSPATLQLTLDLAAINPHCCTWLASDWGLEAITAYWSRASDVALPEGKSGLLRFYDPCVLLNLHAVLSKGQWRRLAAPLTQWLLIDPAGQIQRFTLHERQVLRSGRLQLAEEQLEALNRANRAHHLIAELAANEHIALDLTNFALYRHIAQACRMLAAAGIDELNLQYQFTAMTLDWPEEKMRDPLLAKLLPEVPSGKRDVFEVIEFVENAA